VRTQSAIVPVEIGDENAASTVSKRLLECGFMIPAIRYPTVARGRARLRVAVSALHDKAVLSAVAEAIEREKRLFPCGNYCWKNK
jgi:7-keto-8-aminopelargonate synthetase-like enzyme